MAINRASFGKLMKPYKKKKKKVKKKVKK